MGAVQLLRQLYTYTLGGTNPPEAASASGDIAAMIKFIAANIPGAVPAPVVITPWSWVSIGTELAAAAVAAPATAVYPSSLRVYYVPFRISQQCTVLKMFTENGAAVSGNLDVGIYNETAAGMPGTKVVTMGSTAHAGLNQKQELDIADQVLNPGRYYMAIVVDNTTGAFISVSTLLGSIARAGGIMQETLGAMPLPATATPVAISGSYLPLFGLMLRTTL